MKFVFLKTQKLLLTLVLALGAGCAMQLQGTENKTKLTEIVNSLNADLNEKAKGIDAKSRDGLMRLVISGNSVVDHHLAKLEDLSSAITQPNTIDMKKLFNEATTNALQSCNPNIEEVYKDIPRIDDIAFLWEVHGALIGQILGKKIKQLANLDMATEIRLTKMLLLRTRCILECILQLLSDPNKVNKDTETYIESVKKNIPIEEPLVPKTTANLFDKQGSIKERVLHALWSFEGVTFSTFWTFAFRYILFPRLGLDSSWNNPACRLICSTAPLLHGAFAHYCHLHNNSKTKTTTSRWLGHVLFGPDNKNHYAAVAGHLFNSVACSYLYNH